MALLIYKEISISVLWEKLRLDQTGFTARYKIMLFPELKTNKFAAVILGLISCAIG